MLFEIIMTVCFYPILFIMYFVIRSYRNYKEGLLFGCSLEYEYVKSKEIEEIKKSFVKQMNIFMVVFIIAPLTTFFISYMSIQLTIWMIWLIAVIVFCSVPFAIAHERVMKLKTEKGWNVEIDNSVVIDTKLAGRIRTVKIKDFIIPVLVSIISCIYAAVNADNVIYGPIYVYSISVSFLFATLVLCMAAFIIDRKKCDVICSNSDINSNYNRASKKIWRDLWVVLCYINTIVTAAICFSMKSDNNAVIMVSACMAEAVIMTVVAVLVMKKKDSLYKSYSKYMDQDLKRDDDAYWKWGMFYYNPNDKHVSVNKRVGIGTTVNMASGVGKFTAAFTIIILLSMIPVCGFVIRDEFTPINIHVENNVLICSHTSDKYKLDVDKISEAKVINKLPQLSRTNGTGMEKLLKGDFSSKDYGKCNVLLNPENKKFIELKYEGKTYFLSSRDDKSTEEVYNKIK